MESKLLTTKDRLKGISIEFNYNALLETDSTTRINNLRTLEGMGVVTINDIAKIEGYKTYPEGDKHFMPGNYLTVEDMANRPQKPPTQPAPVAPPKGPKPGGDAPQNISGDTLEEQQRGGPGSGNFGHAGRPGKVGGSASESTPSKPVKKKETPKKKEEKKKITPEEAVQTNDELPMISSGNTEKIGYDEPFTYEDQLRLEELREKAANDPDW
jgi:hypothetical protein